LETKKWSKDGVDHYQTQVKIEEIQILSPLEKKEPVVNGTRPPPQPADLEDDDIPF
jgi:hypothetical protein